MALLRRSWILGLVALCGVIGMGCRPSPPLSGIVEETAPTEGRVLIARDAVPEGGAPESSWLAVTDPKLLDGLMPGQRVAYRLREGARRPEVASLSILRWASEEEGWIEVPGERRVRAKLAPELELEDQAGRPVDVADWRGGLVLVDFIYTRCPGPCPAQTHDLVAVQRGLSPRARSQIRFVSVTLEPEFDDGPTLLAYAQAHGVDLSDWSFLTGEPAVVEAAALAWGIGASAEPDGTIGHTLHSFLVDQRGYVVARYSSRDRDPEAIREEIERFASAPDLRPGSDAPGP